MDIQYEKDLDSLIKFAIETGNKLRGGKIPDASQAIYYSEGLGQKILHHILSAKYLSDGYQLASKDSLYEGIIDFSSMMVLTRAALETYLTFHYIFIHPKEESLKSFRFLCWHISGFLDRADHEPTEPEHLTLKNEEKILLSSFSGELKKNAYFKSITPEAQIKALNGEWRLYDRWSTLAVNAGFQLDFFRQQYKYLCAYSHSSRLSVIQIQQSKTLEEQASMAMASKALLILVLARFIFDYIELMPALQDIKNDYANYSLALEWKKIAETMKNKKENPNTFPPAGT